MEQAEREICRTLRLLSSFCITWVSSFPSTRPLQAPRPRVNVPPSFQAEGLPGLVCQRPELVQEEGADCYRCDRAGGIPQVLFAQLCTSDYQIGFWSSDQVKMCSIKVRCHQQDDRNVGWRNYREQGQGRLCWEGNISALSFLWVADNVKAKAELLECLSREEMKQISSWVICRACRRSTDLPGRDGLLVPTDPIISVFSK